jgi:hypothetical protein
MYKDFYSYSYMMKKLLLPVTKSNIASWCAHLTRRKARHENFDAYQSLSLDEERSIFIILAYVNEIRTPGIVMKQAFEQMPLKDLHA